MSEIIKKRGRKRLDPEVKLGVICPISITNDMAKNVDKLAAIQNLSRSEFIRMVLKKYIKDNPQLIELYNTMYTEEGKLIQDVNFDANESISDEADEVYETDKADEADE